MTLYDESGNAVELDLEAMQNAIDTLSTFDESYDDLFTEDFTESELLEYYVDYVDLNETVEILTEKIEDTMAKGLEYSERDKNVSTELRDYVVNVKAIIKRYKMALRERKYDVALKELDAAKKLTAQVKAEVRSMPVSKGILQNITIVISFALALASLIAIPIVRKSKKVGEMLDKKGVSKDQFTKAAAAVAGNAIVSGGITALLGPITNLKNKVKDIREANNRGETPKANDYNAIKNVALGVIKSYEKYLGKLSVNLTKLRSFSRTVDVYDTADDIQRRIEQLESKLNRNLDPAKARKVREELAKLKEELRNAK